MSAVLSIPSIYIREPTARDRTADLGVAIVYLTPNGDCQVQIEDAALARACEAAFGEAARMLEDHAAAPQPATTCPICSTPLVDGKCPQCALDPQS